MMRVSSALQLATIVLDDTIANERATSFSIGTNTHLPANIHNTIVNPYSTESNQVQISSTCTIAAVHVIYF
jgi:hypothetical protein